jgi:hypothetical protein
MSDAHRRLMSDFCFLMGLVPTDALMRGDGVEVEGTPCSFEYLETPSEHERLRIYADFGPLPSAHSDKACRRLLEVNLYLCATEGPLPGAEAAFALSPETGRVMLADTLPLRELSAEKLRERLGEIAALARTWRENGFFEPEASSGMEQAVPFGSFMGVRV